MPLAEEIAAQAPTNARLRARLALRYSEAAEAHRELAKVASTTPAEQQAAWQRARDGFRKSAAIWQELRDTRRLIPADAARLAEVARALAECEPALTGARP